MAAERHILIPEPDGPYVVGYSTARFVDEGRIDPYDPAEGKRKVMTSLFYPIERSACKQMSLVSYMPPTTTAYMDAGIAQFKLPKMFEKIKMQVCSEASSDATKNVGSFPLVLLSPGLTFPRHQYNAMAQKLASAGFAVVTMDYAGETFVVEWPDGTFVTGKPLPHWDPQKKEQHEKLLATRVEDARFVLTQLGSLEAVKQMVPEAVHAFNTEKAAIVGHSFGGATAISALMKDTRFVGAINMDGSQYGPLLDTNKPILLFGRGEPNPRNRSNNPTWQPVWEHLKGWKKEVNLKDCEHTTFCDTPLLIKQSVMPGNEVTRKWIGTLDGGRAFEVVTTFIQEFVDFVLKGRSGALFDGPSRTYSEITFS